MNGPASPGWTSWAGRALLVASALVSAFFFVSRWAINAPGLGARDAGLALSLSFAVPLSLYACAGLAALSVLLAAVAALAHRAWQPFLWAALVAAIPFAYLGVLG
ncbi:MAG TPA: hypothetical protein VFQ51_04245 [Vicinamibacteria bacterium]|nr:hypothetical protein [Vicinamibacteria bacterium]